MEKIWTYDRRTRQEKTLVTRDYCCLYTFLDAQVEAKVFKREDIDYSMLENHRKIYKTNRNIKEIERESLMIVL